MLFTIRSATLSSRALLALTWGILSALILASPILLSHAYHRTASIFYLAFSFICHQNPARSFHVSGYPLPVCHRCLGIYIGLFLGSLAAHRFALRTLRWRRFWVLAAGIPMLFDVVLSSSGIWIGSGPGRFLTGLWFGYLISTLLLHGVAEFLADAPWRRLTLGNPHLKKGYSWIRKEC
jgi:uncharacterized membrane protein